MLSTSIVCLSILGKKRFLKDSFSLAVVDSRHHRSCFPEFASSRQQGIKYALQSIQIILIRVPDSELLTDLEPFELSSSTTMLSRLFFRDKSATSLIKLLVQSSRTFDFSYDACFQKACVADIIKHLVSFGFFKVQYIPAIFTTSVLQK